MSNTRKPRPEHRPTSALPGKVFDLDAVEREARRDPFPFKLKGRVFTLPHLAGLDRKILSAVDEGDAAAMTAALREGLGSRYAEFDRLPLSLDGVKQLFEEWMRHSGLAVGESPASTGS